MAKIPNLCYNSNLAINEWTAESSSFEEYLKQTHWFDRYKLDDGGSLQLHWAECGQWRDQVRLGVPSVEFQSLWISDGKRAIQMSYGDLYQLYSQGKLTEATTSVSFIGPQGPFESLPWNDIFSLRDYRLFLYKNILEGKMGARSFRLHFESSMMVSYGENFKEDTIITLKQLTPFGALFECKNEMLQQVFGKEGMIQLWPKTAIQERMKESELPNAFKKLSEIQGSLLFAPDKKYKIELDTQKVLSCMGVFNEGKYYFAPYSSMSTPLFKEFFEWTKLLVHRQLGGS